MYKVIAVIKRFDDSHMKFSEPSGTQIFVPAKVADKCPRLKPEQGNTF